MRARFLKTSFVLDPDSRAIYEVQKVLKRAPAETLLYPGEAHDELRDLVLVLQEEPVVQVGHLVGQKLRAPRRAESVQEADHQYDVIHLDAVGGEPDPVHLR